MADRQTLTSTDLPHCAAPSGHHASVTSPGDAERDADIQVVTAFSRELPFSPKRN
jgi:hypothetical protein